MRIRLLLLIPLLCVAVGAQDAAEKPAPGHENRTPRPEPIRPITFRDAMELGLAYNYGIKSARYRTLIQRFAVAAEDAAWDPVLNSDLGGGKARTPTRSQLGGADVLDVESLNFTFGVSKPLRFGPSFGLEWRSDRTFTNSSFSTINPAYDTALALTLTVPLLQGRGRKVQEAALRRARASLEAERQNLADDVAILVREVGTRYWNLVALQSRVVVLRTSLEVARDIEATERRKMRPDIGRSTLLDVTIAHSETKRREAALIRGRRDAGDSADSLRQLILPFTGAPSDRIRLVAVQEPADTAEVPELDEAVQVAIRRRPDLLQLDAEIMQLQENVILAQNRVRVQLDLTADLSWRAVGGEFSESAKDTLGGKSPSASAALNLIFPFGQRAARAELQRALLELERLRIDRREKANTVITEVRAAHRALRTAILEIGTIREEVQAASDSLDGERKRLGRGSSTVLDVSRLQQNLVDAELRLLEAQATLETAGIAIYQVTGTMLDEYQIVFGPDFDPLRTEELPR